MQGLLSERALWEIFLLGSHRVPAEVCGIVLPTPFKGSWIIELPNRSKHPQDSFEFTGDDVKLALAEWVATVDPEQIKDIVLFHTHPSGGIGPSRIDMRNRIADAHQLVVAITDEGPVPSWY